MNTAMPTRPILDINVTERRVFSAPNPDDPRQAFGRLNPAAIKAQPDHKQHRYGPDEWHIYERIVEEPNISRIAHCVAILDDESWTITDHGVALEHDASASWSSLIGEGGVEDPRITWIEELRRYVMTYTVYNGIRALVAIALSEDLTSFQPLGLVQFAIEDDCPYFAAWNNKDAIAFPEVIWRDGTANLCFMHRPMVEYAAGEIQPAKVSDTRQSIWMSFVPLTTVGDDFKGLLKWSDHTEVMTPQAPCEQAKIGGGTTPIRIKEGWLIFYHGVSYLFDEAGNQMPDGHGGFLRTYVPCMAILDGTNPTRVLLRSDRPLFECERDEEKFGVVNNVIFPTGLLEITEDEFWLLYGAGDRYVIAARLTLRHVGESEFAQALAA